MKYINHFRNFIVSWNTFGFFIVFVNYLWHLKRFVPHKFNYNLTQKKHEKVEAYLYDNFGDIIVKYKNQEYNSDSESLAPIWVCWLQGIENMPEIPRECLNSIIKFSDGHPVNLITLDNYQDYISIPNYIQAKYSEGKILHAHYTDIIRTALLYKHGGLWVDATILLTNKLPSEVFNLPFYTIKGEEWGYFITQCRWANYFMSSEKGNPLFGGILELFYSYLEIEDVFIDYFLMDYFTDILYKENKVIRRSIDQVPNNNPDVSYLRWHLNERFDELYFNKISKRTFAHKLVWRGSWQKNDKKGNLTYYGHILNLG